MSMGRNFNELKAYSQFWPANKPEMTATLKLKDATFKALPEIRTKQLDKYKTVIIINKSIPMSRPESTIE